MFFINDDGIRLSAVLEQPENVAVTLNGLSLDGNYARVAQTIHVEDVFRFTGPVLILHGDEDDLVPLDDSKRAEEQYTDCELREMKGETHHFDRHPEQMKEIITEWMEKLKSGEE